MTDTAHTAGPGPRNHIADVPGLAVGHAHDAAVRTGVTALIPTTPCVVAGDVRGGGPGTRETDLLDPSTLVDVADAVVLSGGSSYGLAAADGVAAALGADGRGFQLIAVEGVPPSPIVPAAILYDLANGGDKAWGATPPYAALGRAAYADAKKNGATARQTALGAVGAGYGAMAGAEQGGLGSASYVSHDGFTVGAMMAVNCFGSTRMSPGGAFWSWPFELNGEFGGARPDAKDGALADLPADTKLGPAAAPRHNTTIGVVAVDAALTQADARRIAVMAQDGIARSIRPVHGPTDGDVIFVLGLGPRPCADPVTITRIGSIAADCVARAVARGVYEAGGEG